MPDTATPTHQFDRFGRSRHLRLAGAPDLALALTLDEALWVATSAMTATLRVDPRLLVCLDEDASGRIRVGEIKAAIAWMLACLSGREGIDRGSSHLALDALDTADEGGAKLLSTAERVLARLGLEGRGQVGLEEVRGLLDEEVARGLSEAGIVSRAAAPSSVVGQLIEDILATVGGVGLPSGDKGVDAAALDRFVEEAAAFAAWSEQAPEPLPGVEVEALFELVESLRVKVEAHFALSDAVALDARVEKAAWPSEAALAALDYSDPAQVDALLEGEPLAKPEVPGVLDFEGPINPRFKESVGALREAMAAMSGASASVLTRGDWAALSEALGPHRQWQSCRPEVSVGGLPRARLEASLGDSEAVEALRGLIDSSHEAALKVEELRTLEKLILYQAGMLDLANSFASFPDLYDPESRALFEMGTLIMDGRHFTLAVRVLDRVRHARLSNASNMFVLYVEISTKQGAPLYEVAVPVTSGAKGNLQVGKHGVFMDIEGAEQLATVVHIVENPISFREAIASPFKRLGAAITGRIEKMTTEAEKSLHKKSFGAVEGAMPKPPLPVKVPVPATPPPKPPPPPTPKASADTKASVLAGGGIALAALGSSVAFITQTFAKMGWEMVLATAIAIALTVIIPVTIVALIKLRRRDLSAILEGSGWGINARMYLTRRQARTFTYTPPHPKG